MTAIRILFILSAIYDGLLGLAFLLAAPAIFSNFGVQPPNHWGYVHFPAALLIVFALMFLAIALRPVPNRNLIPYGVLLKVSYIGIVLWHWSQSGIPSMWKPFALIDLLFMLLFIAAYRKLASAPAYIAPASAAASL